MDVGSDPVWTDRPDPVSRQNPIGVTTTRNRRLLNDLVYPLLSDAITYRLRYISFWAWVLANTDAPGKETRARYEKIFFLTNIAHDCPDDGHSTNGIVGAERSIDGGSLADRYAPDATSFDLTAADFALTSMSGSGFDTYYQSLMQRLWLIHGKMDLTPIGHQLASAFDDAIAPSHDDLQNAVQAGEVPQELIQQLAADGCCCHFRAATEERRIVTGALLANFERTDNPTALRLRDEIAAEPLALETWYPVTLREADRELDRNDSGVDVTALPAMADDEEQTTLAEYFQQRLGERGRASLLLFLATAERIQTAPSSAGWDVPAVAEIRTAWQLFVHTHYFVIGTEALLKAWLHGLRYWDPIGTEELLGEIFDSDVYHATIQSLIAEDCSIAVDESNSSQLWRCFDAIYYGSWFDGALSVTHEIPTDAKPADHPGMWDQLIAALPAETVADEAGISLGSARVLHELIQDGQSAPSDLVRAQHLAGVATVLLAQLYRRGQIYDSQAEYEPYRRWFEHIAAEHNPLSLWRLSYDETAPISSLMKSFTRDRIIATHQSITNRKIRDHPSQTSRHMRRRADGDWEFKSMYTTGHLSQSWLRIERMLDALYELNLTTAPDARDFRPTDDGRQLLGHYGVEL